MPGLYSITTRVAGETLTAAKYNADHQNHVDNQTPQQTDDYSSNATQMQTGTDPGEVGTESLPTSLAGELERIRFTIEEFKSTFDSGVAQWYESVTVGDISLDSSSVILATQVFS